ncbi:hypothetical protein [Chryseobacterium sp. OSA05B]|uniref:hypothetical protein n=1 Tax=Chryseobacterium sp. OSA05B TaxID=2862650 RepID=UPI001CBFB711|nr:hypothetical protein [Chryseobacterium sp. OSA05B]
MKKLFLTLLFFSSFSVIWGQEKVSSKVESKPSRPIIERNTTQQNDSIAKNNVGTFMQKSKYNESFLNKNQNNSQVQINANQLQQNNLNFNNTSNGSFISPSGKVVNPTGTATGKGSMQVGLPIFKTK